MSLTAKCAEKSRVKQSDKDPTNLTNVVGGLAVGLKLRVYEVRDDADETAEHELHRGAATEEHHQCGQQLRQELMTCINKIFGLPACEYTPQPPCNQSVETEKSK